MKRGEERPRSSGRKPGNGKSENEKSGNKKPAFKKPGEKKFGEKKAGQNLRKSDRPFFPRKLKAEKPDDGTIRLNKYIANAGICSRREADVFIESGLAEVNGVVITELGYKVQSGDEVKFDGKRITAEKNVYILLNKPKGFITTTKDERNRRTVMDLIENATTARVFPVGRLDRATTGLLLFTNDGHLTKKLTHPSHTVKKIYHVKLDRNFSHVDMEEVRKGVRLIPEGIAVVDNISYIEKAPKNEVGIEIHIGWNHVVRRIFEKLGYKVEALDRVYFAGLTKKNLERGKWRKLTDLEVGNLKML